MAILLPHYFYSLADRHIPPDMQHKSLVIENTIFLLAQHIFNNEKRMTHKVQFSSSYTLQIGGLSGKARNLLLLLFQSLNILIDY